MVKTGQDCIDSLTPTNHIDYYIEMLLICHSCHLNRILGHTEGIPPCGNDSH